MLKSLLQAAAVLWCTGLLVNDAAARTEYVEGEVIVTLRTDGVPSKARTGLAAHELQWRKQFEALSAERQRRVGVVRELGKTTAQLIEELQADPLVENAEPNYLRWKTTTAPSGPVFGQLWALRNTGQTVNGVQGVAGKDISALSAWGACRFQTTNPPVVAVIDSGIYYTHPDLSAALWGNPNEIPGNEVDDDGNGYIDDYYGYSFVNGNAEVLDPGNHGTHIAGTIAATGANQQGMVGVSRYTRIMALAVSTPDGEFTTSAILEAMDYALAMKHRGVNLVAINGSYAGGGSSTAEREAIRSLGNAGVIFCAAAGNDATNDDAQPTYPASYRLPTLITVAATDQDDNLAEFSNYGVQSVHLGAPGVNIVSTTQPLVSAQVTVGTQKYTGDPLEYSGSTTGLTGTMHDCGLGYPTNFPAAVKDNIALIERGTLYFTEKVSNAMAAGAKAALIYNNVSGQFAGTLDTGDWIPTASLSREDGLSLRLECPIAVTLVFGADPERIYTTKDGTSMATPHVAGAVALAALNFPDETATQRVARVLAAVDLVSGLSGKVKTGGRLNLARIVDTNLNTIGDWWELSYFGAIGIDPQADPDLDDMNNLTEFIAGTNPLSASSRLAVFTGEDRGIRWVGGTDSRQVLQTATSLGAEWVSVLTNEPPTQTSGIYLNPQMDPGGHFYRLEVERP